MRTLYAAAAGAALIVFTVSVGAAAPKQQGNSPSAQARVALEQIDDWASAASTITDRMQMAIAAGRGSSTQLQDLDALRTSVNNIGNELSFLDGNRGSIAESQVAALNQVTPLMADIASTLNRSIEIYNSQRVHLWATAYRDNMARIYSDIRQVKGILDSQLKSRLGESLETR